MLKAKLSESRLSCGNQRSGTSGERANHFRPFGPWQTRTAVVWRLSTSRIAVEVRLVSKMSATIRTVWKVTLGWERAIGSKR
jgi:hypothetical protein